MSKCQWCGQGSISEDAHGPICPDCIEEGLYEKNGLPKQKQSPTTAFPLKQGGSFICIEKNWASGSCRKITIPLNDVPALIASLQSLINNESRKDD